MTRLTDKQSSADDLWVTTLPSLPLSSSVVPEVRLRTPPDSAASASQAEDAPNDTRLSHPSQYISGELDARLHLYAGGSESISIINTDLFFSRPMPKASISVSLEDILQALKNEGRLEREKGKQSLACLKTCSLKEDRFVYTGRRMYMVIDKATGIVLEDFWNDTDIKRGTGISNEMLVDVAYLSDKHDIYSALSFADIVRNHIVNIEKDIYIKVGEREDHPIDVVTHGELPLLVEKGKLLADPQQGHRYYQSNGYRVEVSDRTKRQDCARKRNAKDEIRIKRHCRVMYKEVGRPIYKSREISEASVVLDDVTLGMCFLEPHHSINILIHVSS